MVNLIVGTYIAKFKKTYLTKFRVLFSGIVSAYSCSMPWVQHPTPQNTPPKNRTKKYKIKIIHTSRQ